MPTAPGFAISTDFPSLANAIANCDSGRLFVPSGSHSAGSGITINRSIILKGAGRYGRSVINSSGSFALRIANGVDFCRIEDLELNASGYGLELGDGEGIHVSNILSNNSVVKTIGPNGLLRSIIRHMRTFISPNMPFDFRSSSGHRCLFIIECNEDPGEPSQTQQNDCVHLKGWGHVMYSGYFDGAAVSFYRVTIENGSLVQTGIDYEGGDGAFLRAMNNGHGTVLSCEFNSTGHTAMSAAPPILRAQVNSSIRLFGLRWSHNVTFPTWASTDGSSAIAHVECSRIRSSVGSGGNGNVSGNVYNYEEGAFGF